MKIVTSILESKIVYALVSTALTSILLFSVGVVLYETFLK